MSRILNRQIVNIRNMTEEEFIREGWIYEEDLNDRISDCLVIELSGGVHIFPSRDEEGNDSGVIFLKNSKGGELLLSGLDEKLCKEAITQTITCVSHNSSVLHLSSGMRLLAVSDEEGNDAGMFFGYDTKSGECFYFSDSVLIKTKKPAIRR